MFRPPPRSPLFPYTTLFRSAIAALFQAICARIYMLRSKNLNFIQYSRALLNENKWRASRYGVDGYLIDFGDRKSTRLNSSHGYISYAVFCLKKKNKKT